MPTGITLSSISSATSRGRYLPSQFGAFGLGDGAQLKLSPTRRIEIGSIVFGFTSF